jgi:predicted transcriptional regulator
MAKKLALPDLSRRERQIVDALHRMRRATAAEVREAMPSPPSYSAVRTLLRILEDKGHVRHEQDGPRYVYLPTVNRDKARRSAIRHLVRTFFDGSTEQAVATLLDLSAPKLSDADRRAAVASGLRYARCMRAHGEDVPDPSLSDEGGGTAIEVPSDAKTNPAFLRAQRACEQILREGGLP